MDKFTKEERSKIMKTIRSEGSQIETLLMKALWAKGYRYRKHVKSVLGRPDIVFKTLKIAIFCDSEFWHGNDWDTMQKKIKSNVAFWHKKIERNIHRDKEVNAKLISTGWRVLRFWGKNIQKDVLHCVSLIENAIIERKKELYEMSNMDYIRKLSSGKSQIIKDKAFCELLKSRLPDAKNTFTKLFDDFDSIIKKADPSVTKDALNNAHGNWYEWLIAVEAWNCFLNNPPAHLALLLPNVKQFDVSKLYITSLSDLIDDLRNKVAKASSVQLITSNPDFVIFDRQHAKKIIPSIDKIDEITPDNLKKLENAYNNFVGTCAFDNIVGFISVKTSFRPDRRLQIPHEGSLMKALYTHLQTRQWIIDPRGLKYYAIASKVGPADRTALKTVATHSITTVHTLPQAAVDEVFQVNSLNDARSTFKSILSSTR